MASKTAWKGAISIGGLLTIPVKLEKATSESRHEVRLHEYHAEDMGASGRRAYCKACNKDITSEDIIKGFEVTKGQVITLSKAELECLPLPSAQTIDVNFVSGQDIPALGREESYYITPDTVGVRAFNLLMQGMTKLGKVAVGKVAIRGREHICAIQPCGSIFTLDTFCWSDEINNAPQIPSTEVKETEIDLITQVIGKFSTKFDHTSFRDDYNEALKTLVDKKMKGETIEVAQLTPKTEPSLEEALRLLVESKPDAQEASENKVEGGGETKGGKSKGKNGKKETK